MIIEFEKFILGIRPDSEILKEAMYKLKLDGNPTSLGEINDLREKEEARAKFWGRSDRLYEQASYFGSSPDLKDREMAEKLLCEAGEWAMAEHKVIGEAINSRVTGGYDLQFEQTPPWKEFDRLKILLKHGEVVAVLDYPIVAVGFTRLGWKIEMGQGKRADMDGSWEYAEWAVKMGKDLLDRRKFEANYMSCGDGLNRKYRPRMRVDWSFNPGGVKDWWGKQFMALGTILMF
jgi:hypothetical protein